MHDYYAGRLCAWPHHQSQAQPMMHPYYNEYDGRFTDAMQRQLVKAFCPRKYGYEDDSEDNSDIEKAIRAHIQATSEYETVKGQFDNAKKKLEESEAKVEAATQKLERVKKELRIFRFKA